MEFTRLYIRGHKTAPSCSQRPFGSPGSLKVAPSAVEGRHRRIMPWLELGRPAVFRPRNPGGLLAGWVPFKKKATGLLSIDFGHAAVKIAYLESLAGEFRLLAYDFKKILSSEERYEELTVRFINSFIRRNSIVYRDAILSISNADSVIIRYLVLPVLPKEEILKAATWQLKEEIPFDFKDALLDWQLAREYTDPEGAKKNGVIFIVAKRQTIDKYLSTIYKCNLNPLRITSGPFNYANFIAYSAPKERPYLAILDIGHKSTTLCIYNQDKLNFERRLAFSSEKITQALNGVVLVSDKGRMELSYEEAENIKNTFGIPRDGSEVIKNNVQAGQIISLIRPLLEGLVRELKLSFDYFLANYNLEYTPALYLTGGGANLKNLVNYLSQELNVSISRLPLPKCILTQAVNKEKLDKDLNEITNVLAAALCGPGAINLLPQEIKTQKAELIEKISLRLIAITVGAVLLFSFFFTRLQIGDYKNRLKNAKLHLQLIKEISVLKQKTDSREGLIDKIRKDRVPVDGFLKLISALTPQQIILEELSLDQIRHKLVLKGIVAAGQKVAEEALTDFMQQLEESSFLKEASLVSCKKIEDVQKFEISCDLAAY